MKLIILAILALAVCGIAMAQTTFGFTEDDYRGDESIGTLQVTVLRSGPMAGVFVVNVRTLTAAEYAAEGFDPASPAEPDVDFVPYNENKTFIDEVGRLSFDIEIIDDNIIEEDEEQMIIMVEVVDSTDPFTIFRQFTTGIILDNDDTAATTCPPVPTCPPVTNCPPPVTTPTSVTPNPGRDCPGHDVAIGITFLITFLLTLLCTCLLAAIIGALCVGWDRKRRAKAAGVGQLEQQTQQRQQDTQQ